MTNNDNRWQSPPTTVMPAAPRKRRSVWDWLAPVLAMPVSVAIGGGLVHLYYTEVAAGQAPSSCIEALELSDELMVLADEYSEIAGRAIEAVGAIDADAADAVAVEAQDFSERWDSTYAAYETARDECRAEGGAL